MGFFDAFRKQTPTDHLRKEVAKYFEKIAEDAVRDAAGDPSLARMMIVINIFKFHQELEQNNQIASICAQEGINFKVLLEEERQQAMNKYLRQAYLLGLT